MSAAVQAYEALVASLAARHPIETGQMFGKVCAKTNGKAFLAQHKDMIVFKLPEPERSAALKLSGAALWDPSGMGRPMSDWIALPLRAGAALDKLAEAARAFAAKPDETVLRPTRPVAALAPSPKRPGGRPAPGKRPPRKGPPGPKGAAPRSGPRPK